jgi:NADH:ubiquinone oxidoreductase subunit 4 (subunit M)
LRAAYEPASRLPQTYSIVLMVIATIGIVLATAYVARFARLLLQGVPTRLDLDRDLVRRESLVVVVLLLPIVGLGLFPTLITGLFAPIGYTP